LDNRVGFVGVSGEFFCGHSISLKRRARLEHLFFLGYCNDYQQYFPTIEASSEGGYGADPAVSPVETGAGEQMMDRALIRLYKMQGKLPDLPPEKK
jgi:neutral ceramidase